MSDQGYPGQGFGENLQGATGSPTPQQDEIAKELATLKEENAKLRDERRTERANSLGREHALTPTETTLLMKLNADEMEATAKLLAEEKAQAASPTTAAPPAPAEGAPATEAPAVAEMSPSEPPAADLAALAAMGSGGAGAPNEAALPPANSSDAMLREINGASSFAQIQEIQARYKRMQTEAE